MLESGATSERERVRRSVVRAKLERAAEQRDRDIIAEIGDQILASHVSGMTLQAKIFARKGRVTLRGRVARKEEWRRLEEMARGVVGEMGVVNQLVVHDCLGAGGLQASGQE